MIPIENIPQNLDALLEQKSLEQYLNNESIMSQVERIVDAVRNEGDKALVKFSRQFDGVELEPGS